MHKNKKSCQSSLWYLMAHPRGLEPLTFWSVVKRSIQLIYGCITMAVWTGLEPATSCVTGRHSNQLNYQTKTWLREKDLNQRPPGYEPDELPDCSIPRYMAEKEGFEPPRAFRPLSVFKTGPFNHLGISPYTNKILKLLVDPTGLEPVTNRLWAGGSNQLSYGSKLMVAPEGFEPTT